MEIFLSFLLTYRQVSRKRNQAVSCRR